MPCDHHATGWGISPGSGSIILNETELIEYAMDAGDTPGDNGRLKVCTVLFLTSHHGLLYCTSHTVC